MFYPLPAHQRIAAPNSLVTLSMYEAPTIGRLWKDLVGVQGLNSLPQGCMIFCEHLKYLVAKELEMQDFYAAGAWV